MATIFLPVALSKDKLFANYYVDCTVVNESDLMEDNVIDGRRTTRYGERGDPLREEADRDADGVLDRILVWKYDDIGRLTQVVVDMSADGIVDWTETYLYDHFGREIVVERDSDGDGYANEIVSRQHDHVGNVVVEAYDVDADESIDHTIKMYYNDQRYVTRWESYLGGARVPEDVISYGWSISAVLEIRLKDEADDGIIDERAEYSFDVNHRPIRTERDLGNDGSIEDRIDVSYDMMGQVIRRDNYRNGHWRNSKSYKYDRFGRPLEERIVSSDLPPDGSNWTYSCP